MNYCAQGRKGRYPNRSCASCSLTNYGLDCHNNPVPTPPAPKRLIGTAAATATYRAGGGFTGSATMQSILQDIGDELRIRLTGHELGLAMLAVARAYHKGRQSHQGIDVCDDCVWLPWGGGLRNDDPECNKERGQLIPIAAIRAITVTNVPNDPGDTTHNGGTQYHLDFTEWHY